MTTPPERPLLPPWPETPPRDGPVVLRPFRDTDVGCALELGTDPYVPLIGTLPAHPTREQAADWVRRQQGRWAEGSGFSFAITIADAGGEGDEALGGIGLWLRAPHPEVASAGYAVRPSARGRGVAGAALRALTRFAWTLDGLQRVELHIEAWNVASVRVAKAAGYRFVRVLPQEREIGGVVRDMQLYVAGRPDLP